MNKFLIKFMAGIFSVLFLTASTGGLLTVTVSALAHEGSDDKLAATTDVKQEDKQTEQQKEADRKAQVEKLKVQIEDKKGKLEASKLKVCKTRENKITDLRKGLNTRRGNNLNTLNTIFDRVQAFYQTKNLSVSNYDALVATVNQKKDAATAAVNILSSDSQSFNCDGTDPLGNGETFRTDHQKAVAALKEYKTALKALIEAVKVGAKSAGGTQ
jgi:hypothetical protein